jgi:hypothetical protein
MGCRPFAQFSGADTRQVEKFMAEATKVVVDPASVETVRRERRKLANRKAYAKLMALPAAQRNAFTSARQRGVYRLRGGMVRTARAANVCAVCGGRCEHSHHLDPLTKLFPLGKASQFSYSQIVEEAAKTTCLCGPHHRDVHAGRVTLGENPPRILITPEMLPPSAPPRVVALSRRIYRRFGRSRQSVQTTSD